MYTKDEENFIILSSVEEISDAVKRALVFKCADTERQDIEKFLIKTLSYGVYNTVKEKLSDGAYRSRILSGLEKRGITCVACFSESYPDILRHIDRPPLLLYCKGNVSLLKTNCFAVVGSRKSTANALALCRKISSELTAAFTVVSGIADGADTAALSGALLSGKAISVTASGFDNIYPSVNVSLAREISEKGLLVSEYPPHMRASKYNFPVRNRIIAGLSKGVLVASAGEKSGALITAECASEYGRDVFAFPYSPHISSGAGCNSLIKNGAYLTENILDIFSAFGLDLKRRGNCTGLSALEKAVLGEISKTDGALLSAVADSLGKQTYEIIPVLTALEIKGLAVRLGGNRYGAV